MAAFAARANPLQDDLRHVLSHTREVWDDLRGRTLFITGGSGFVGSWLLETFLWANDCHGLNATAVVLTRDPAAFQRRMPHLTASPTIQLHHGDVRTFAFPDRQVSHVVHAASEASGGTGTEDPLSVFGTAVEGTRRVLDFATRVGVEKVLLASSGAVYGRQPPELLCVDEDFAGGPDPADPRSAYGEGKRAAELLGAAFAGQGSFEVKIARGFAFLGPRLPLDRGFAVGNFLRDALRGGPIRVAGDGTPYRSYLYAADLAIWLWQILVRGRSCRPYNVGSDIAISISELARRVAAAFDPAPEIEIACLATPGVAPARYVPSVRRAETELGLRQTVELSDAIHRTVRYLRRVQQGVDHR